MQQETKWGWWYRHLKNFPLGLLLGAAFALFLAWAIDGDVGESLAKNGTYIFSALASLLAASIALVGVFSNIENQNQLAERNRLASLRAAKAVLPLALTKLYSVAEAGFDFALEEETFYREPSNRETILAKLALDAAVLSTLKECISFGDEVSSAWLSAIIRKYQICFARHDRRLSDHDLLLMDFDRAGLAANWAILLAMVAHSFEFARGGQKIPEILVRKKLKLPLGSKFFGHAIYSMAWTEMAGWAAHSNGYSISDLEDLILPDF